MSSGNISSNGNIVQFEINHNNIQGHFTLALLPSEFDTREGEQRVLMKLTTKSFHFPDSMTTENSVIITKSYTKVLAHFFRSAAEQMDKWYSDHIWRYSDSSQYDAVCTKCGCTDESSKAKEPCPSTK
jgi:hypothetical protein